MRQSHRLLWILLAVLLGLTGCHGGMKHRGGLGRGTEPALTDPTFDDGGVIVGSRTGDPDALLVDGTPEPKKRFPNRPLFRKTQEAYDSAQGNGLAKGAKATFVGVPQGIGAEVKQLFTGAPAPTSY